MNLKNTIIVFQIQTTANLYKVVLVLLDNKIKQLFLYKYFAKCAYKIFHCVINFNEYGKYLKTI